VNSRSVIPLVLLVAVSACASHGPRLQIPDKVEADCESRSVRQTAIESIVASTDDQVRPGTYPGEAAMRKAIRNSGGAIAHWTHQPLRLPNTAKTLGVDGDYLDLVGASLTNSVDPKTNSRPVWLTFKTPTGEKTVLERAYDTQNVCIEGTRQI
jgi:hypothetical protein